jgi:hypothetical protein
MPTARRQHMRFVAESKRDTRVKRLNKSTHEPRRFSIHPKLFIFFDKKTCPRASVAKDESKTSRLPDPVAVPVPGSIEQRSAR